MSDRGEALLALDVGGTHCRVRLARIRRGRLEAHEDFPETESREVDSRGSLEAMVRETLARIPPSGRPERAVIAAAGAVQDERRVRITNWPQVDPFDLDDLAAWGLPSPGTSLVNDAVAGAHGLVSLLDREGPTSPSLVALTKREPAAHGNRVMIVPGTGLGGAGIVHCDRTDGDGSWKPVPSETGHGPAAVLDAEHERVVESLRGDPERGWPTWEAFVSGRGLESVYEVLRGRTRRTETGTPDTAVPATAGEIARVAVDGTDPEAAAALDLYYRSLGRFAQMMALAFTARGGVFIGGESTRRNRDFIVAGRLLDEFRTNPVQRQLLSGFPVFLVLRSLNLLGAISLAARRGGTHR